MSEQKELTGKDKIIAELRALEYELTVELPKTLRTAAALGDLSENSEYKFARERQDYVRARVRQLQQRLSDQVRGKLGDLRPDVGRELAAPWRDRFRRHSEAGIAGHRDMLDARRRGVAGRGDDRSGDG